MKALSVHQPWANLIRKGRKTLEIRTWTPYLAPPFDLLIVSTKKNEKRKGFQGPFGSMLCVVKVVGWRPMVEEDIGPAWVIKHNPNAWSWILEDVRPVMFFPVRGQQLLYEVPDDLIEFQRRASA